MIREIKFKHDTAYILLLRHLVPVRQKIMSARPAPYTYKTVCGKLVNDRSVAWSGLTWDSQARFVEKRMLCRLCLEKL